MLKRSAILKQEESNQAYQQLVIELAVKDRNVLRWLRSQHLGQTKVLSLEVVLERQQVEVEEEAGVLGAEVLVVVADEAEVA